MTAGYKKVFYVFFWLIAFSAVAAEPEEFRHGWSVVGFPAPYYTPESGLGLAGVLVPTYREDFVPKTARPDSFPLTVHVTTKKQYGISVSPEMYFLQETWVLRGKLSYTYNPAYFYGLGNTTPDENEERFIPKTFYLQGALQRKFASDFSAGIIFLFRRTIMADVKKNGLLHNSSVPGAGGGFVSGIGPVLEWDSRNHAFVPDQGGWYRAYTYFFKPAWGSDRGATQSVADLRQYFSVGHGMALALQGLVSQSSKKLPFDTYSELSLRGISEDRFRDRSVMFAQSELRFPLIGRVSGVLFFGAGDVYSGLDQVSFNHLKMAGGTGVRYQLSEQEKINARLDLGFSAYGIAPYILLQESF